MQRQRGELVPVAEVIADLPGPGPSAPQNPTTGAAGLHPRRSGKPVGRGQRSGPGSRFHGADDGVVLPAPHQPRQPASVQARFNGPFRLYMQAGAETKLPFGNIPRLLMAWVCTEVVRTRCRELVLGRSLAEFMRTLGHLE